MQSSVIIWVNNFTSLNGFMFLRAESDSEIVLDERILI